MLTKVKKEGSTLVLGGGGYALSNEAMAAGAATDPNQAVKMWKDQANVVTANTIFAPPVAEVAWARRIIAAFDLPENRRKGVINLDGRMVELLHAESARRTVGLADAIAALGA